MNEIYQNMQSRITADEALIERTLAAAEIRPKRKPILKYTAIAAAAACFAMVGSVPVLAQNVPSFYHALYKIAPETAERFKPLEMISESNGIRMEVGGIYFHENTVEAYITMQDLEGDRLGNWEGFCSVSSLRTSPEIVQEQNAMIMDHTLKYADYDAETKTLTFLLSIEVLTGELSQGDEVTFDLDRMLGNYVEWEGTLDGIDWQDANGEFCTGNEMYHYGGSTEDGWKHLDESPMLRPSASEALPAKSVTFTGAGYQDGLLHVQVRLDELKLNNDGVLWLQKTDGTEVFEVSELRGCKDKSELNDLTGCWKEFVFAVDEDELAEYSLRGKFQTFTTMVEGDWEVTFTLPNEE